MSNIFRSNGKLLLTGEYLVLKGAIALALPLKLGQSIEVVKLETNDKQIMWESSYRQNHWFSAVLDKNTLDIISTDEIEKAKRLSSILAACRQLNENLFSEAHDYRFCTQLDFYPQWGLGSSSTLINNLSNWADVNPYQLLQLTFKGSGYDIACAKANEPIFYKVNNQQSIDNDPFVDIANFNPIFKDNLYFIYQGHKQISSSEVKAFLDKNENYDNEISYINEISRKIPYINNINDFCHLMKMHEDIISACLKKECLKKQFPDFDGAIKSLGAWGGDFFMAATEWNDAKVKNYFENKGHNVIFKYNDIVL